LVAEKLPDESAFECASVLIILKATIFTHKNKILV
jgi:hypothetical protein